MHPIRILVSLAIGVATASVLSYIRGGFSDSPWVLLVFGSVGFFGSLFLFWLFRRETMRTLERVLGRLPRSDVLRCLVAACLVASLIYWSGPVIFSGGFGGWIVAMFLAVAAPLVVCLVAPRFPILFGILAVTCITASLVFKNAQFHSSHGDAMFWADFWQRDIWVYLMMWFVFVALSLIVSVPIHVLRRRGRSRSGQ